MERGLEGSTWNKVINRKERGLLESWDLRWGAQKDKKRLKKIVVPKGI